MSSTTLRSLQELRASTRAAISRREVAEVLGIDPRTVSAGIESGAIPSVRIGRRVLIPREPFIAMFSAPTREAN